MGLIVGKGVGLMESTTDAKPYASVEKPPRVRPKSRTSPTDAERERASRFARIREMAATRDFKAREEFTGSLGADDVPDLLAVFLADAGLEGIGYREKGLLEKAVRQWVSEDVNAALAWANLQPQPKIRRYFQKMMLGEHAKTDPFDAADRALEIEAGDKDFDASGIVAVVIGELAKKSGQEQAIAELMRKAAVKDGNESSGASKTFAEDFAHESLLNSMAEIQAQGLKFRFVPMGMLSDWAKRDPEAAHAWSLANGRVGFEEWQDVLHGVTRTMGQEASGQWFLGKYSQANGDQRKMMVGAFDDTYDEPAARMVLADHLARQMPAELAGEFVEQILIEHFRTARVNQAEGLSLLEWYPTPEERADVLFRHAGRGGVDNLLKRFPESGLMTYGVSRETLEAAGERAKKQD